MTEISSPKVLQKKVPLGIQEAGGKMINLTSGHWVCWRKRRLEAQGPVGYWNCCCRPWKTNQNQRVWSLSRLEMVKLKRWKWLGLFRECGGSRRRGFDSRILENAYALKVRGWRTTKVKRNSKWQQLLFIKHIICARVWAKSSYKYFI